MALVKTPAFESETTSAAAAPAAATPVVVAPPAGAVAVKGNMNILETLKNALVVDYNTLAQVIATNGNFVERETKTVMGDQLTFEVMSFQDSWVVSPNDDKAGKEFVRFSDDGVNCSDGTPVAEHLAFLKEAGWSKAALRQRIVLVGAVTAASKTANYNGTLMQFDLSPTSRTQWLRYQANAAYAIKVGKHTEDQVKMVKAQAELAQNGSNTYTLFKFSVA